MTLEKCMILELLMIIAMIAYTCLVIVLVAFVAWITTCILLLSLSAIMLRLKSSLFSMTTRWDRFCDRSAAFFYWLFLIVSLAYFRKK